MENINPNMNPSIKIEDEIIDLDAEEPISVCKWDEQIRLVLLKAIEGKSLLENLITYYKRSLQEQIRVCKTKVLLKNKILEHLNYFKEQYYLLSDFITSTNYFELMEDILSYYCTLELDVFKKENRRIGKSKKEYMKNARSLAQKICTVLAVHLDKREMHILHVLLKVKYSCKSDQCKVVMKSVYRFTLFCGPVQNYSDEAFCRNYIIFLRYKVLMPQEMHQKMDFSFYKRFKKSEEAIKRNEVWNSIFMINPGSLVDAISLIMDIKCNIVSSYFNYIRRHRPREQLMMRTNSLLPVGNKEFREDQLASRLFGDSIVTNLIISSPPLEEDTVEEIINLDEPIISKVFLVPSDDDDSDVEITYIEMIKIDDPDAAKNSIKSVSPVRKYNKEQLNITQTINKHFKNDEFEKSIIFTGDISDNSNKISSTLSQSSNKKEKAMNLNESTQNENMSINTAMEECQTQQTNMLLTNINSQSPVLPTFGSHTLGDAGEVIENKSVVVENKSEVVENKSEVIENKLEEMRENLTVSKLDNSCLDQIMVNDMNMESIVVNDMNTSQQKNQIVGDDSEKNVIHSLKNHENTSDVIIINNIANKNTSINAAMKECGTQQTDVLLTNINSQSPVTFGSNTLDDTGKVIETKSEESIESSTMSKLDTSCLDQIMVDDVNKDVCHNNPTSFDCELLTRRETKDSNNKIICGTQESNIIVENTNSSILNMEKSLNPETIKGSQPDLNVETTQNTPAEISISSTDLICNEDKEHEETSITSTGHTESSVEYSNLIQDICNMSIEPQISTKKIQKGAKNVHSEMDLDIVTTSQYNYCTPLSNDNLDYHFSEPLQILVEKTSQLTNHSIVDVANAADKHLITPSNAEETLCKKETNTHKNNKSTDIECKNLNDDTTFQEGDLHSANSQINEENSKNISESILISTEGNGRVEQDIVPVVESYENESSINDDYINVRNVLHDQPICKYEIGSKGQVDSKSEKHINETIHIYMEDEVHQERSEQDVAPIVDSYENNSEYFVDNVLYDQPVSNYDIVSKDNTVKSYNIINESIHISAENNVEDTVEPDIAPIVESYEEYADTESNLNNGYISVENVCRDESMCSNYEIDSLNSKSAYIQNESIQIPIQGPKYDVGDDTTELDMPSTAVLYKNTSFLVDTELINSDSINAASNLDKDPSNIYEIESKTDDKFINVSIRIPPENTKYSDSVHETVELEIPSYESTTPFLVANESNINSDYITSENIPLVSGYEIKLCQENITTDNIANESVHLPPENLYDNPIQEVNLTSLDKPYDKNTLFLVDDQTINNDYINVQNIQAESNDNYGIDTKKELKMIPKIKIVSIASGKDVKKIRVLENSYDSQEPVTHIRNSNLTQKIMYTSNPSEFNNNKRQNVESIEDFEESFSGPLVNIKPIDDFSNCYLYTNININNKTARKPSLQTARTDKYSSGMKNDLQSPSRRKILRDRQIIDTSNNSISSNIKKGVTNFPSTSGTQSKHISWPEEKEKSSNSTAEECKTMNLKNYYMQYSSSNLNKGILKKPKHPKSTTVASKLNLNVSEAYEHLKRRRKPSLKDNIPTKVRIIEKKNILEEKGRVPIYVEQNTPKILNKELVISLPKYSENELIQQYNNELNIRKHNTKRTCIVSRFDVQKNKSSKASPSPVPKPADYFKDHPVTGTVDYSKYICDDSTKFRSSTITGPALCVDSLQPHNNSLFITSPDTAINLIIPSKVEEEPQLQIEFSNSPKFLNDPQQLELCLLEKNNEESTDHSINNLLGNVSFLSDNSNFYTTCVQENEPAKNTNVVTFYNQVNAVIKDDARETNYELDNIIIYNNVVQGTNNNLRNITMDNYDRIEEKIVHKDFDPDMDKEVNKHNYGEESKDNNTETRLPFKKRRMSVSVKQDVQQEEISYPATPMISIAELDTVQNKRTFKTPAERKEMPSLPPPIYHTIPSTVEQFNTFNAPPVAYHMNNLPYLPFYSIPSMLLPFNNIPNFNSTTNIPKHNIEQRNGKKEERMKNEKTYKCFSKYENMSASGSVILKHVNQNCETNCGTSFKKLLMKLNYKKRRK